MDLAITLAITTDDALAAQIASKSGCTAEHMEAYGVAAVCARSSIPFAAALGVANVVGSTARDEWRANNVAASEAAAALVIAWLEGGAAGLAPGARSAEPGA